MTRGKASDTSAFEVAYNKLNPEQKRAVDTIDGPVMVVAGPGTGKTQVLTLRIANILLQTDTRPENILALTFTNSGVRAMRERLRTYIKDEAYRVNIYTFHSFAEHILQSYSSYFPAREFASVIGLLEKAKIIEHILSQQEFSKIVSTYDRFSSLKQVMGAIDDIKQEGLRPDEFESLIPLWEKEMMESDTLFYKVSRGTYKAGDIKPAEKKKVEDRVEKAREIATVFAMYQRELEKRNLYDFSDMILTVLQELEKNENLKFDLQEQYQYVLVDEHQDTNEGQNKLIEYLSDAEHLDGHPNLFTVGDEKQSIYRFQGASDKAFAHFKNHYADVMVVELEQNYRSTEPILTAAHSLITKSLPHAQALVSNQSENKPISVSEFSDYKLELLFVVKDIARLLATGVPAGEIAIIYRSNKHLIEIKTLFQQFDIPYQVLSRDTLLDDSSIITLITLIKVVANPNDDHNLAKLLFADFLQLDSIAVARTLTAFRRAGRESASSLSLIDFMGSDETYAPIVAMISRLVSYEANHNFTETFKEILNSSGFLAALLRSSDSRSGLRKVEVLYNEFRQQAERAATYRAKDFVEFIDATLAYNLTIEVAATRIGKGVQCMTAHGSKGLEFEHVYLINTARSNWEKSRGFANIALPLKRYTGELDDERRLFYVAITRAKRHLTISSSRQDWSQKSLEPSQFISELSTESVAVESVEAFEVENEHELTRFFSNLSLQDSVFDTEYLAERFMEENLSVTALNNYIDCPLKYLFRNLIQLPDVYTPAARYGSTIHKALESFFVASKNAKQVLDKVALLDAYEVAMKNSGFFEDEFERFLIKGRKVLGMYYDYYHTSWSLTVVIEDYIRRTITSGDVELTLSGKIDKIEFLDTADSGRVRVVDYKTGKVFSKKDKSKKESLERQIQFYHLLLQDYKNGDVTVAEAVLDFVEPTDAGTFEQKTLAVTVADLDTIRAQIATMVIEVRSGVFLSKGCNKKNCDSCAFWSTVHANK